MHFTAVSFVLVGHNRNTVLTLFLACCGHCTDSYNGKAGLIPMHMVIDASAEALEASLAGAAGAKPGVAAGIAALQSLVKVQLQF